jgi:hypothetical protein
MIRNINAPEGRQVGASAEDEASHRSTAVPVNDQSRRSSVSAGMGSLSPRAAPSMAQSRLSKGDVNLASYILGRHVVGRPVQEHELDVLRRANNTVEEVRNIHMAHGRSNVLHDILKTGGHSATLGAAAQAIDSFVQKKGLDSLAVRAGLMSTIGAGTCKQHAAVAQYAHAEKLAQGEQVNTIIATTRGHVFAVASPANGPEVVIDAWAEGPAVNVADANYMNHFGASFTNLRSPDPTTSQNAPAARREFQYGIDEVGSEQQVQRKLDELLQSQLQSSEAMVQELSQEVRSGVVRSSLYIKPEPVISEAFATQVARQLESVPLPDGNRVDPQASPQARLSTRMASMFMSRQSSYVQEQDQDQMRRRVVQSVPELHAHAQMVTSVQAVGIARTLGVGVNAAVLAAPNIVDGAKNLRRPDPNRPAGRTPPDTPTQ